MSTELQIAGVDNTLLAEMMGVSAQANDNSSQSTLARLNITHTAVMGDLDHNGKVSRVEVLPVGTYKLKDDDTFVYCLAPTIRIFAVKEQWTHWDSINNAMDRTEMANNLYGDLKDSKGTFNIGRPSGYLSLKAYEALPQDIKDLMRAVKRTKILFGTINFNGAALDEAGNEVSGYDGEIPFIMDTKNKGSIAAITAVLEKIKNDSSIPIEAKLLKRSITLGANIESVPAVYATMTFNEIKEVGLNDNDNEVFKSFQEWIKWSDTRVLTMWKEKNAPLLSDDELEFVDDFVDVVGSAV